MLSRWRRFEDGLQIQKIFVNVLCSSADWTTFPLISLVVFFSCSQIIKTVLQPKPLKTDTEGTTESVRITLVMLLKLTEKTMTFTRTKYQRNIIGLISIVKLNFSNFHNAVITRLKSTETLKNRSFIVVLLNHNPFQCISFDAKNWRLQIIL